MKDEEPEDDKRNGLYLIAGTSIVAAGIFLCILLALSPFALIWAVNGLFGLNIAYTFINWCYAFVIIVMLRAGDVVK